jgi:hypothetical protein
VRGEKRERKGQARNKKREKEMGKGKKMEQRNREESIEKAAEDNGEQ